MRTLGVMKIINRIVLSFPAADFYGIGIDAEEDVAEDVGLGNVELIEPF